MRTRCRYTCAADVTGHNASVRVGLCFPGWSRRGLGLSVRAESLFSLLGLVAPSNDISNAAPTWKIKHLYKMVKYLIFRSNVGVLPRDMVRGRKNPLHYGFVARLKKARKQGGHSRLGLSAKSSLLDGKTVSALEQGQRIPRLDTVEKIANALGVSPGLLAYGTPGECPRSATLNADGVGARLQAARLARGMNLRDLGRESGTSHTTVRLTETGVTVPNIANTEAIAQALGVSPAWLAFGVEPQILPVPLRGRPRIQPAPEEPHDAGQQ